MLGQDQAYFLFHKVIKHIDKDNGVHFSPDRTNVSKKDTVANSKYDKFVHQALINSGAP